MLCFLVLNTRVCASPRHVRSCTILSWGGNRVLLRAFIFTTLVKMSSAANVSNNLDPPASRWPLQPNPISQTALNKSHTPLKLLHGRRLQNTKYNPKGYSLPYASVAAGEHQRSRFATTSQIASRNQQRSRHTHVTNFDGSNVRKCIAASMYTPTSPRNIRHEVRYATWIPQMVFSARTLLNTWEVLIYHDSSVYTNILEPTLRRIRPHATLIQVEPANYVRSGCFWRLYAFDVCDVVFWRDIELVFEPNDVFLVRDFLSRPQELAAVQAIHPREWTYHRCVLAGIYLAKRNTSHPYPIRMRNLIEQKFLQWQYFGADEVFLCNLFHSLRPSLVYYEPRDSIIESVRLHNELSHMETYVKLPTTYALIGQKKWRHNERFRIWARRIFQHVAIQVQSALRGK